MTIDDYGTIFGIASIFVSGASIFLVWILRTFWALTYKRKVDDDDRRFADIEKVLDKLEEAEEKNRYYRHNFETVTKNIMEHISNEVQHLQEVLELKLKALEERGHHGGE